MRTVKTLKPGQDGTKELLTRFGPSRLYVRYRYDEDRREHVPPSGGEILALESSFRRRELPCGSRVQRAARQKTVELVVQRRSRQGEAERPSPVPAARKPLEVGAADPSEAGGFTTRPVALQIGWRERDLQLRRTRRLRTDALRAPLRRGRSTAIYLCQSRMIV